MNKELRLLYIEDNAEESEELREVLSGQKVNEYVISIREMLQMVAKIWEAKYLKELKNLSSSL